MTFVGNQTIVSMRRSPFIADDYHINRLEALIKAWKQQLVLMDGVCLMSNGHTLDL